MTIRQVGLIPVTDTKGKILIPKNIEPVAQLTAQNGLQSGFDVKGEMPLPVMRAEVPNEGIYKFNPDQRSLLDVKSNLRADLFADVLGSCPPSCGSQEADRQRGMLSHSTALGSDR